MLTFLKRHVRQQSLGPPANFRRRTPCGTGEVELRSRAISSGEDMSCIVLEKQREAPAEEGNNGGKGSRKKSRERERQDKRAVTCRDQVSSFLDK